MLKLGGADVLGIMQGQHIGHVPTVGEGVQCSDTDFLGRWERVLEKRAYENRILMMHTYWISVSGHG